MARSKQLVPGMAAPVLLHVFIEVQWASKPFFGDAKVLLQYLHQLWGRGPVIFHVNSAPGACNAGSLLVSQQ